MLFTHNLTCEEHYEAPSNLNSETVHIHHRHLSNQTPGHRVVCPPHHITLPHQGTKFSAHHITTHSNTRAQCCLLITLRPILLVCARAPLMASLPSQPTPGHRVSAHCVTFLQEARHMPAAAAPTMTTPTIFCQQPSIHHKAPAQYAMHHPNAPPCQRPPSVARAASSHLLLTHLISNV
jgi:hypothetical protein